MLEGCQLFRLHLRTTQLGILGLLDVGQQLPLGLTALERTVLLGVHSQFEQLFVVLTVVPTVFVHFLLEAFKRIGNEGVRIGIRKFAALLLGQFDEFGSNRARHLTALAQNHAPDGIVHHHIAALALLHRQQIHQRDVLRVLRERCHQWGITDTRPYILYLVEQLYQHVVHRECGLALLIAQFVDHCLDRTEVGHHRTHHAAGQTTAEQQ